MKARLINIIAPFDLGQDSAATLSRCIGLL